MTCVPTTHPLANSFSGIGGGRTTGAEGGQGKRVGGDGKRGGASGPSPRWTTLETLAKGQLGFHPRVPRWAAAIGAYLASRSGAPPSPSRVNIDGVVEVCMETP